MLTIYHMSGSRSSRVIWQCEEMGLPYKVEKFDYPFPESYKKDVNPMGGVPYLKDEGGVELGESAAIQIYLAEKYGPTPLLPPKSDPAYAKALHFTVFAEAALAAWGVPQLFARFMAPEGEKDNWSVRNAGENFNKGVNYLSQKLGKSQFIAGDGFTIADIALVYSLGMAKNLGAVPDNLTAYADRLQQRPAFQRAAAV